MTGLSLALTWTARQVPKEGCSAAECEDAFAANELRGRFAVADGASESADAGRWARMLVDGFVGVNSTSGISWLREARSLWSASAGNESVPWYVEEKRSAGAFATLVTLALGPPELEGAGRWQASAVGDSCLFRVRNGQLNKAFPYRDADDFSTRPALVGSRRGAGTADNVRKTSGTWQPADRFFLMTDALAQWFLRACAMDRQPWADLSVAVAAKPEVFTIWVGDRRADRSLRNDDVTLLIVEIAAAC